MTPDAKRRELATHAMRQAAREAFEMHSRHLAHDDGLIDDPVAYCLYAALDAALREQPEMRVPGEAEIARAISAHIRMEWRGHDNADIHPRSVIDAARAVRALLIERLPAETRPEPKGGDEPGPRLASHDTAPGPKCEPAGGDVASPLPVQDGGVGNLIARLRAVAMFTRRVEPSTGAGYAALLDPNAAAHGLSEAADALASLQAERDAALAAAASERAEKARVDALLSSRDKFIVDKGLWREFVAQLPRRAAVAIGEE